MYSNPSHKHSYWLKMSQYIDFVNNILSGYLKGQIALQRVDYERRGREGNNTQTFSCFHHSSQKCKSVLNVILSLEQ